MPKPVMFQKWRSPSRRKVPASLLGQAEPGGAQAAGLVLHAGVVGGAADVGERHDDATAERPQLVEAARFDDEFGRGDGDAGGAHDSSLGECS